MTNCFAVGATVLAGIALSGTAGATVYPTTVAPIALGATAYTQDFNKLASTGATGTALPPGWQIGENDDNANLSYAVGTGSGNGGNVYSFGSAGSTDRALGSLTSGNLQPAYYGALFTNALGTAINALTISYTGEQWRRGDTASDGLSFQYRLTSGAVDAGTWTTVDTLAFASPSLSTTIGALDGNLPLNRRAISATISGLSIAAGSSFAIRWVDLDAANSDDGLAIDDVSVVVAPISAVPEPASWALMLAGFGLVGGVLRRRRATIAFA